MRTHGAHHPLRLAIAALAAAAALSLATPAARGDDRGLLHATQQNPYVFIILDTSGSMHQSVSCTQADHDNDVVNGVVPPCAVCAPGDCLPRLMGDDPDSKISVAKQSIYAIMATHPNINFGFGHYDQTQLQVLYKYWYYDLVGTSPIKLLDGTSYPRSNPGEEHLFGQQAWACTAGGFGGTTFNQVGCNAAHPAHLDNTWEYERVRRYPKLGDDNSKTFSYYFQETTGAPTLANPIYKATFSPAPAQPALGAATYQAVVKVENCKVDPSCAAPVLLPTSSPPPALSFSLATLGGTVYWDSPVELNGTNVPDPGGNGGNFYGGNPWTAREVTANYSNANHQLESNADVALDAWIGATGNCLSGLPLCDVEQLATADPAGRKPANTFAIGDIIPLDWTSNQQTLIANRMAPDPTLGPIRMFGIAPYFADHRVAGETALELKNTALRPLTPEGGTPTGTVMMSFANLMIGSNWPTSKFSSTAASSGNSWIGTAAGASGDPFFSCKTAYVLLLTDGLASSDDGDWTLDKTVCPVYAAWNTVTNPAPGFACCAAEALRTINYSVSGPNLAFPIRTYVIGLGLTTTTVGGYNNTLQCIADEGGTGNRHFFNGNPNTIAGQPKGFPAADPPPPGFCCTAANNALPTSDPNHCAPVNPCDGPGPILPRNKSDVVTALQTVLNLIQSQATAFASAAVPSIQSNVQNKSIITSFLPINQPIWPGRVDAFIDPVPTTLTTVTLPDGTTAQATVPDPTQQCTSPGQQGCHLWNAGDQILAQGIAGFDTAFADGSKRRVFYAPATPVVPGEQRLFLQMPAVTDTGHLFDLENALGLCGPGYSFPAPVGPEGCTENSGPASSLCAAPTGNPLINPCPSPQTTSTAPFTTAAQAVTFAEGLKSYRDPSTNTTKQYLLGDIFHSDPQVLGQPVNVTLFDGNLDNYQAFANAERFRRKVLYFGSNDGQLHAVNAGTVQLGTVAEHQTWVFNNGTGNELFAFVPRTVMPSLNQLAALNASGGGAETFMVDGPPHLAEGFFDATGVTNPCPASNPPAACQWHSLVIGGLREGGRGYYALDVTQPDTLTPEALFPDCSTPKTPPDPTCANNPTVQVPNPSAASYLPNCMATGNPPNLPASSGCGQLAYPMPLWEFTDNVKVNPACVANCQLRPNDEDASGAGVTQPDLGQTWSRPNSGRVRICDNPPACDQFHEQWVVVFGGGMDPNAANSQGNWLYMLDMATGKILYKRALNGSVPSEPAAVDTGQDGWIDTIYVGTTAGHLYKLDLTLAAPIDPKTARISASSWIPFEIFDTEGRQMFYPPAVFFDTDLDMFGLAWGTGDRQDLWKCAGSVSTCVSTDPDRLSGRFFVILDRDTTTGVPLTSKTAGLPFKAANLPALTPDGAPAGITSFLLTPAKGMQPGWYLDLKSGERVLTEAFALSGILIFSSYVPSVVIPTNSNSVCADTGDTRVFVLKINNGDAIGQQVAALGTGTAGNGSGGTPTNRYYVLSKDLGLNVNTSESTPIIATKGNPNPVQPPALPDTIKKALQNVMANIKLLMPSNCRFSAKRINVTVTDTFNTQFPVAAVPECIIEKNWKEF